MRRGNIARAVPRLAWLAPDFVANTAPCPTTSGRVLARFDIVVPKRIAVATLLNSAS